MTMEVVNVIGLMLNGILAGVFLQEIAYGHRPRATLLWLSFNVIAMAFFGWQVVAA